MQPDKVVRMNYEGLAPEYEVLESTPYFGVCVCGYCIKDEVDYHAHMAQHALSYWTSRPAKRA